MSSTLDKGHKICTEFKQIINMGNTLQLDFSEIEISSFDYLNNFFKSVIGLIGSRIEGQLTRNSGDFTLNYLLDNGSLNVRCFDNNKSMIVDFYLTHKTNEYIKKAEELICDNFNWKKCSNNSILKRGQTSSYLIDDLEKAEILRNVELLHREKSDFQEIRIYDTQSMGRILVLDDNVQISSDCLEDDNYTVDLVKLVLPKKNESHEHVIIIGGGDLIVATYILKEYPNIKKLTVCEIDARVIELKKTYFLTDEIIEKSKNSGRLEIIINGGAAYMEELLNYGKQGTVGAVVIDCTDFELNEDSLAAELYSSKFYTSIYSLLNAKGGFSQQITKHFYKDAFYERASKGGFKTLDVIDSNTPEYGYPLPLASCFK